MSKNWEYAAGVLWPVLVTAAKDRRKLVYGELADLIKTNPLSVGNALEHIQAYCMDSKLPPLSAIVVGKSTGLPGGGFVAWDIDDIETAFEYVFNYHWSSIPNPFGGFSEKDSIESLSKELVEAPTKAKEIYTKVKVRGIAQRIFRAALLQAYDYRCAICGFSFVEALEAAHIIPWAKSKHEERISPCNGILMCSNHHRLFDSGLIKITTGFEIIHEEARRNYSDADAAATVLFNSKHLRLPKNISVRPSAELIKRRNQT